MRRTIVTIYALHLVFGEWLCRIRSRVGSDVGLNLTGRRISIFHPRNGLPAWVGGSEADMDTWAQVSAMNTGSFPADHHREDRLRMRVAFVLRIFVDHTQIHTRRLLWPVTVLTGLCRGNKAIAFDRRWNR